MHLPAAHHPVGARLPAICREPAARPVHTVCQVQPNAHRFLDCCINPLRCILDCRSVACPAICRGPAAKPVHAVCQVQPSCLVLLPLRGRSRASALLQGLRQPDIPASASAVDFALLHQYSKRHKTRLGCGSTERRRGAGTRRRRAKPGA
jgi:hypothetical protein